MIRLLRRAALAAALALLAPVAAEAETLVAATSTSLVQINSNFTGTEITVFGAIERDRATVSRAEEYRLAIQVFGPRETVVTRRKERTAGLWVNGTAQTYVGVPSFYATLTSSPIGQLSTPETLRRYQIGVDSISLPERLGNGTMVAAGDPDFRAAFLRLKLQSGRYRELPGAVQFLTPSLFKAVVPLPAHVPVGHYRIHIVLLQEGVPLAEHSTYVVVTKTGFERFMDELAFDRPLIYGIGTVILALFSGWIAGIIFRKD